MLAWHNKAMLSERRAKTRYPIQLTVRYRTISGKEMLSGIGRTTNISSSGLLLEGEHAFQTGMRLEVALEWPTRLDSSVPLQLAAHGKVVRVFERSCVVVFSGYQFRTMKRIHSASAA